MKYFSNAARPNGVIERRRQRQAHIGKRPPAPSYQLAPCPRQAMSKKFTLGRLRTSVYNEAPFGIQAIYHATMLPAESVFEIATSRQYTRHRESFTVQMLRRCSHGCSTDCSFPAPQHTRTPPPPPRLRRIVPATISGRGRLNIQQIVANNLFNANRYASSASSQQRTTSSREEWQETPVSNKNAHQ